MQGNSGLKAAAMNLSCLTARGGWLAGSGFLTWRADGVAEVELFFLWEAEFFSVVFSVERRLVV